MTAAVIALAAVLAQSVSAPPSPSTLQHFTVSSDGHPLAVWARIPPSPRGAVLLLHGRTWSSRPDFDLQVPGLHRSVLESLEARGIAAYALDARGYGATPRDPSGWLTPNRAAADVAVVLRWIAARHPALGLPTLVGWSLGAATAHLAAASTPSVMSSVVLFGYAPDPDGEVSPDTDVSPPARVKTTAAAAASDFISPKVTPPIVVRTFIDTALKTDPIAADWRHEEQFTYNPSAIRVPTLVIYGERDPGVEAGVAERFLGRLGTKDRQLVVVAGGDHCAHLEDTHDVWVTAVAAFANRFSRRN